jgi:Raf kinase inhibitor-like YbhB/YbcL family protein
MADRPMPPNPYDFLPQVPSFTVTSSDVSRRRDAAHAARQRGHGRRWRGPLAAAVLVGLPEGTKSFAVTVYDPDAPTASGFWHWAVANIPASVTELPAAPATRTANLPEGAVQLRNDGGFAGYVGAAPPAGHGPHRYFVVVHAVDTDDPRRAADTTPAVLGFNLFFHTLARATMVVTYEED